MYMNAIVDWWIYVIFQRTEAKSDFDTNGTSRAVLYVFVEYSALRNMIRRLELT